MKQLVFALVALTLTGCGYSYSEIEAAKASCRNYNGSFGVELVGDLITKATCTVDGVTYRIDRTQYQLHDGRVK